MLLIIFEIKNKDFLGMISKVFKSIIRKFFSLFDHLVIISAFIFIFCSLNMDFFSVPIDASIQ